jgi:hypothetical protein
VQIIATSRLAIEGIFPTDYLSENTDFKFSVGFIQTLNSSEIKELITNWFGHEEDDARDKMQKLIRNFVDFGLPKTPLSVTLFLWIMETQERRPLNNAVLVEMFVENILSKTNIENIYSDNFDFKNKQRLLSFIAKEMRSHGDGDLNYSLDYVKLLKFMDDYLKTRFVGKPQKILDDFMRRGIFRIDADNLVQFKSPFLFHYFLALHFDINLEFKEEVLTDENYLNYVEEIIYYSGIKRDDPKMLDFTQKKLTEGFEIYNQTILEKHDDIDNVLNSIETMSTKVSDHKMIEKSSNEKIQRLYDDQLEKIPVQNKIENKDKTMLSTKKNLDIVLRLASIVLKNSEDVDDFTLKTKAYQNILTSSIAFLMLYRNSVLLCYKEHKKSPDYLPQNIDFRIFIWSLPYAHQLMMYDWLGTMKLRPVITDKMDGRDKQTNISEFERFLSVFIYADIRGADYPQKIVEFVKTSKFNYTKDIAFFKIYSYYHLRANNPEIDRFYIKMMADIREALGYISKSERGAFISNIEKRKLNG